MRLSTKELANRLREIERTTTDPSGIWALTQAAERLEQLERELAESEDAVRKLDLLLESRHK